MRKPRFIDSIEFELGSGNVYADLGCPEPEAMLTKAHLVTQISKIIKQRRFTQESERRLLDCLTRLGRDVEIVIKPVLFA